MYNNENLYSQLSYERLKEALNLVRRGEYRELGTHSVVTGPLKPLLASYLRGISDETPSMRGTAAARFLTDLIGRYPTGPDERRGQEQELLEARFMKDLDPRRIQLNLALHERTYWRRQRNAIQTLVALTTDILDGERRKRVARLGPRKYGVLRGRREKVAQVVNALREPTGSSIVCIEGIGGIGKTALAREACELALDSGEFSDAIWISLSEWAYEAGKIMPLREERVTAMRMCDVLALELGYPGIAKLSPKRKTTQLRELLQERRILVVVDGIEDFEEGREIVGILRGFLGPSRALLTSRTKLGELDSIEGTTLGPLEAETPNQEREIVGFLREECKVPDNVPDQLLLKIHTLTGGIPLAMKLVAGHLHQEDWEGVRQNLVKAGARDEQQLYRFIYSRKWDRLTSTSRNILMYVSALPRVVRGTDLPRSGLHTDLNVTDGLRELWRSNLLEIAAGSAGLKCYGVLELTRHFVNGAMAGHAVTQREYGFLTQQRYALASRRYLELAKRHWKEYRALDEIWHNAMECARWCRESRDWASVVGFWEGLSTFLWDRCFWTDYLTLDRWALQAARASRDLHVQATILCELGWVSLEQARYAHARKLVSRATRLYEELGHPLGKARCIRYLGQIALREASDLESAERLAQKALEALRLAEGQKGIDADVRRLAVAMTINLLGNIYRCKGNHWHAARQLHKSLHLRLELFGENHPHLAPVYLSLGKLYGRVSKRHKAEHYLTRCLYICEESGEKEDIAAGARLELARLALCDGQFERALSLATEATASFRRIGIVSGLEKAGAIVREVTSARESGPSAFPE